MNRPNYATRRTRTTGRWSRSQRNLAGQTIFTDEYFDLFGLTYADTLGDENDDFGRTEYDYDQRGRMHRIETPDILDAAGTGTQSGTITRRVFDGLGRLVSVWQGDDDIGATSSDPSNGGSNDMVLISTNEYDKGGIGDSNLTKTTVPLGPDEDDRVTVNWFDWRNRFVATKDGVEGSEDTGVDRPLIYYEHDNLGQTTLTSQYDGDTIMLSDGNNDGVPDRPDDMKLRARMKNMFDEEGQMFRSITYTVDPSSGATSQPLTSDTWFNQRGLTIKMRDPSGTVMKNEYDGVGRTLATYVTDGGGDADWSDADDVDSDIVLSQTEYEYDTDSNVVLLTVRERLPGDVITTGVLGDASGMDGVAARVSYVASYYDLDNRLIATVNVGTFGGAVFTRPDEEPLTWADSGDPYLETLADETLITSYTYDDLNGWMESVTDPRGIVTAYVRDDAGRVIAIIDAFDGDLEDVEFITLANITTYAPPGLTENRIVTFNYDADGRMVLRSHLLPGGGVQQTRYVYGVERAGTVTDTSNDINSRNLLREIHHPDKTTGLASESEKESFTYNELGQLKSKTDRNETQHVYKYDVLGRLVSDAVTVLGSGVDGAIRRIETAYDDQGNAFLFTSFDAATDGNVVNQVKREFDGLSNLLVEWQEHDGEVDGSTPFVDYIYAYTGNNQSRLEAIIYPDGRIIHYIYASGLDDTISRLSAIADDDGFGSPGQVLEAYTYMGTSTVVERLHPESGVNLTYIGGGTGDAGDIVTGLDRFGRIVDHLWIDGMSTATDRFQYGYDENSNRLFRRNVVDATFSELYDYDDFNQLSDFARGTLSTTSDSIVGIPVRSQDWSPHPLGNAASISTDGTPESRTYNAQNQFDTVGGNPLDYDANGNLIVDQNGNDLVYDAWNRLISVADSMTILAVYTYNPLNRRIIEDDGTTETHLFYSANWQVLEEQIGGETTTQYVWSPIYIDAMILRDRDTDSDGDMDERLYVQQDANFNVTALVDTSGVVVQRYVQDPFGLVTDVLNVSWATTTDAFEWKYLHQGLRFDAQVDKYDNRMRIYDPVLQRFIQVDPIRFEAGDGNLYRYEGNAPINGVDPAGQALMPPAHQPPLYRSPSSKGALRTRAEVNDINIRNERMLRLGIAAFRRYRPAAQLLEQAQANLGLVQPIRIELGFLKEDPAALGWVDATDNTIRINPGASTFQHPDLIAGVILMEALNFKSRLQFALLDAKAGFGKLSPEAYVRSKEYIEFLNVKKHHKIAQASVAAGVWGWRTDLYRKSLVAWPNFAANLKHMKETEHSTSYYNDYYNASGWVKARLSYIKKYPDQRFPDEIGRPPLGTRSTPTQPPSVLLGGAVRSRPPVYSGNITWPDDRPLPQLP